MLLIVVTKTLEVISLSTYNPVTIPFLPLPPFLASG
jgi:hypothetical protein